MLDQRLWMTHIRLREQHLMREAESDRLANEYWRTRLASNPLWGAMREVIAVCRARITAAAHAETETTDVRHPTAREGISPILAEAEEIVRLCCADPIE
jgi:hypothetical protein